MVVRHHTEQRNAEHDVSMAVSMQRVGVYRVAVAAQELQSSAHHPGQGRRGVVGSACNNIKRDILWC